MRDHTKDRSADDDRFNFNLFTAQGDGGLAAEIVMLESIQLTLAVDGDALSALGIGAESHNDTLDDSTSPISRLSNISTNALTDGSDTLDGTGGSKALVGGKG